MKRFHSVTGGAASTLYMQPEKQLLIWRGNATNFVFRAKGVSNTATANAAGNLVGINFSDGYTGLTNPVYASMYGLLIYNADPAPATLDAIDLAVEERYGIPTYTKTWMFCGDSLTAGFGSVTGRPYAKHLQDMVADSSIRFCNEAGSGATTLLINTNISRQQSFYNAAHTENKAFVLAGTNDLRTGVTPATITTRQTSIVTSLKTTGFDTYIMTIPPGASVNETDRLTVNASINGGSTGADHVIDIGSDARFLVGTNFYDGLHFNDAGNAIVAELIEAEAFSNSEPVWVTVSATSV